MCVCEWVPVNEIDVKVSSYLFRPKIILFLVQFPFFFFLFLYSALTSFHSPRHHHHWVEGNYLSNLTVTVEFSAFEISRASPTILSEFYWFSGFLFSTSQPASYGKKSGMWYAAPGNQGWGAKSASRNPTVLDADVTATAPNVLKPSAGRVIRIINNLDHNSQVNRGKE